MALTASKMRSYKRDAKGQFATTNAQKAIAFRKSGGLQGLKGAAQKLKEEHTAKTDKPSQANWMERAVSQKKGKDKGFLRKLDTDLLSPHAQKQIKTLGQRDWSAIRKSDAKLREHLKDPANDKVTQKGFVLGYGATNVKLNHDPSKPHLVATYRDRKGNSKKLYQHSYRSEQDDAKFTRAKEFDRLKPKMLEKINKDLQKHDEAKVAYVVAKTGFRMGSDKDTKAEKKAFGISNMRSEHVTIVGDKVQARFTGKEGVSQYHEWSDPKVVAIFAEGKARGGEKIFANTNEIRVNKYLNSIDKSLRTIPAGKDQKFLMRDFRTSKANEVALAAFNSMKAPTTKLEYQQAVNKVGDEVCKVLGNKREMALGSYIDPKLFDGWKKSW